MKFPLIPDQPAMSHISASVAFFRASSSSGSRITCSCSGIPDFFLATNCFPVNKETEHVKETATKSWDLKPETTKDNKNKREEQKDVDKLVTAVFQP